MKRWLWIVTLGLAGCVGGSGGDGEGVDGGADLGVGPEAGPDEGPADAAPDALPEPPDMAPGPCGPVDVTLPLAPEGEGTQIHPAVAADGAGLWVVYNRVTPGASTFDVWATRLGCDGRATIPPFEVSEDPVHSDVDPSVAVGPSGVLFAWTNDVSDADPNLITRTRLYDLDGTPRGPSRPLVTTREGAPFGGGQWMVQVAALDEGFVVVGSRGVEARSAFQVYGQRLDGEGDPVGPTASQELDGVQQLDPDVAVSDDGTIWIAWSEGDQGAGEVVAAPWRDSPLLMVGPSLSAPAGSGRMAGGARPALLGHVERGGGTVIALDPIVGPRLDIGGGAIDVQPGLAAVGDRGVLAWFRRIEGSRSALWFQRVDLAGDPAVVGEPVPVATEADAAPYPMAITALADGRVAIVWVEGISPDFRARVRYVMP